MGRRRSIDFFQDESAQALVTGVISMFFILPAVALVYNVSLMVNQRIAMQQAADAAAISGALVEANLLSTVAVGNEAMAYTYYGVMRKVIDVIVTGVLAEFQKRGAPDAVVGIPDAAGRYNEALAEAAEWVPRGERWMRQLSEVNQALARVVPRLMREEMAAAAKAKGAEGISVFPMPKFWPQESEVFIRFYIDKLRDGWRITNDGNYLLEMRMIGPRKWQIVKNTGMKYTFELLGPNHCRVTLPYLVYDLETDGRTFVNVAIDRSPAGGQILALRSKAVAGGLWNFAVVHGPFHFSVEPLGKETFRFSSFSFPNPVVTEELRWDENNRPMLKVDGEWTFHPRFPREIVGPDGQVVPVIYDNRFYTFPGGLYQPPGTLLYRSYRFIPPRIFPRPLPFRIARVRGKFVLYDLHFPVRFRISGKNVWFSIYWLTLKHADGRWRPRGPMAWHRIVPEPPSRWVYEYKRFGTGMTGDSLYRLGHHAVLDNDPAARPSTDSPYPPWTRWFMIGAGKSAHERAYYQTRPVWDASVKGRDYDGDGVPEVRIYQADVKAQGGPFQQVNLRGVVPLRLRGSFWVFGLNVLTWCRAKETLMGNPRGRRSLFSAFSRSKTGFFGSAAARVGFLHRYRDATGALREEMRFNFNTLEEADDWGEYGYQCLYEPIWTARLVPMVESVRSEHIDPRGMVRGVPFLFQALRNNPWYNVGQPERFGTLSSGRRIDISRFFRYQRNRRGRLLDVRRPDFEKLLLH